MPLADVTRHINVGQEMHLYADHPIALAGFAATALDVERIAARAIAACTAFRYAGEQVTNRSEQAGVCGRVRARRATDRALVDIDNLVEELQALNFFMGSGFCAAAIQVAGDDAIQRVIDQRRFATAGNASDAGQQADRNFDTDILEIVASRTG